MDSTNYYDTFIAIAPDSDAVQGVVPKKAENPSVAYRTFAIIRENPYRYTSDDVIFAVHAARKGIPEAHLAAAREEFFSKPQPCLRASDLGKRYGWGIHYDANGRVALYGVESEDYAGFVNGQRTSSGDRPVTVKQAMRSRR